jgi:hypothetical protein
VQYRKGYVQSFFDEIIKHNSILCYELTEIFLKEPDSVQVEAALSIESKTKGPILVKDMIHIDGTVLHINFL